MARTEFGGTLSSWAVSDIDAVEEFGGTVAGTRALILPREDTALQIALTPQEGQEGSLVTDFVDSAGSAVSQITIPASQPYIPRFFGPDGVTTLYVRAAGDEWLPIPRTSGSATGNAAESTSTPAFIRETPDGYPTRSTVTSDTQRMVIWVGPNFPPEGGAGGAITGSDVYWRVGATG